MKKPFHKKTPGHETNKTMEIIVAVGAAAVLFMALR